MRNNTAREGCFRKSVRNRIVRMEKQTELPEERKLQSRIANLLENESLSDVVFLVDQPAYRYACHKLILALGSQVFKAMFYGKIKEQDQIRVPDVTKEGFSIMLKYLYSGEIQINSEYEAFEAAYASKKYLIKSLFKACENYLLPNVILDFETVFSLYEEAAFLEMKQLQSRCLGYVSRNAKILLHSESFHSASKTTIQDVLRLDLMDIESEVEIIEAIWRWGQEQCKELDIECSKENIRLLTKDFLQYVRFLSMKTAELGEVLEKFQLLDSSERLSVLWNLAMPKVDDVSSPNSSSSLCAISRTRSVSNCSRLELPIDYRYDGNLNNFMIDEHRATVEVTVTGPPIVIIGAVLAFKPIPCYSALHRTLNFELRIGNKMTNIKSCIKSIQKAQDEEETGEQLEQELLLDEYVEISEGEKAELSVEIYAEGIRVMQCLEKEISTQCGESCVTFHFNTIDSEKLFFPIKELMYVCG